MKKRLGSQLTKYLGGRDKVKVFVKECRAVDINLGDPKIIQSIAKNPEWFSVILNYSQLGLLPKLGEAITRIKEDSENV